MENEWVIVKFHPQNAVKHIGCYVFGTDWDTRSVPLGNYTVCCGCNVQIPKHILLQWKLLNDK